MKTAANRIFGVYLLCLVPGFWTAALNGNGDSMLGPLQFSNVSNFSTFLLDPSSGTLYLGARDAILAVDANNLRQKHTQIVWDVPEDKRRSCVAKGKTEGDCHNYIRLLEFTDVGRIYVCGTYAFDPQCAVINMEDFSLETTEDGAVRMETGKGKCPFEPSQHYTAVMADGVLYAATTSNFLGTLFDISRATGSEGERIRTEQSINWLSDPEFVSSSFIKEQWHSPTGDDDKIYFFFTEVAKEYDLYTKVKVPRVARVCKGDVGGMKTLQKRWTTFLKAQLVCEDRASGQRYNILTNVFTKEHQPGEPSTTHFYGIFTSQWEKEELSAVCVYSLADINRVMAGPFKELKKTCDWMIPEPVPHPRPGQCITSELKTEGFESSLKLPDKVLTFVRDHPLMENSVVAAPLLVRRGITYTRIAVTLTSAANGNQGNVAVLLLGTDRGELHRVAVLGQNATLLQEIPLFTAQEPVNNILLYQDQALVGSPLSLVRVIAEGCGVYPSCEECAPARALGCVWSPKEMACTPTLTGVLPADEDALKLCDTGEARCVPVVQELRVFPGLRVVLQCAQVSPRPCRWEHPPARHTRQRHANLEVTVTADSLGTYTCYCEEGRSCPRASYTLALEGPQAGGAVGLAGSRQVLALYLLCFVVGVVLGGCLLYLFGKRRSPTPSHGHAQKGRDLLPSSDTPQSPSSASLLSEAVPLTEKRNGTLNGHGNIYTNTSGLKLQDSALNLAQEMDSKGVGPGEGPGEGEGLGEGLRLEEEIAAAMKEGLPMVPASRGAPLAQCEESSI